VSKPRRTIGGINYAAMPTVIRPTSGASPLDPPPAKKVRRKRKARRARKEPRIYGLIREIAAEKYPSGYKHIENSALIKTISDELEKRGLPIPKRDVFLRALDRRKG
jgi:hypothetical protein